MGRKIRLITLLGIALAAWMHLSAQAVHACSLVGTRPTPSEELARSDAAFIGKVIGINEPAFPAYSGRTAVQFEATAIWKGPNQRSILVYANYSPEVAAEIATHPERHFVAELAMGQEYLIFALREKATGILITDRRSCSYIQGGIIPYSLKDAAELGPPALQADQIGIGMPVTGSNASELVWLAAGTAILCIGVGFLLSLTRRVISRMNH